jgi:hypothetical protein
MASFDLTLKGQDTESLARCIQLEINGKKAVGPVHSLTKKDADLYHEWSTKAFPSPTINLAAENLTYEAFNGLTSLATLKDLQTRFEHKLYNTSGTINIVYPRIPRTYEVDKKTVRQQDISDLQASSVVGIELDSKTDIVIPPMPGGVSSRKTVTKVIERTINEIQTFNREKPMMAYIPHIDDLELVTHMVKEYLKKNKECRIFGVDFSGSCYPSPLLRAVIRTIRTELKIKKNSEKNELYYLHAFNVAKDRKSTKTISPATDILVHAYGIDSTSGVIWGGGDLVPEKCRYALTEDYGSYRKEAIMQKNPVCSCPACKKYSLEEIYTHSKVLPALKVHRMHTFEREMSQFSERITNNDPTRSYLPYIETKKQSTVEIAKIMGDVKEILLT